MKWFESFLRERCECAQVNDVLSDFLYLPVGVPQGLFLGPLLSLIYINDQPGACVYPNSKYFADDTNLIRRTNQDELFLRHKFLENIPKWLSVSLL